VTGKRSREKGARGERMLVSVLSRAFPDARRGRQYDSARECDVEGTPFRLENKFRKTITYTKILEWLARNVQEAELWEDPRPALLVTKRDREPAIFHGFLEDLVKIAETLFYKPPEDKEAELKLLLGDVDEDSRYR
jgi:hypothetical protein